jgi:hypothetical protein
VNTFVLEIFDDEGAKCTFYTVRWEYAELSETHKFLDKVKGDARLKNSLQELAKFLEIVIGDEKGALEVFFRFENTAHALPPAGEHQVGEITINYGNFPLRLYCLRISDSLVVLFNGAEKTSKAAQDGKTSMAFHEANQFAKRILEALREKEIYITSDERVFRNSDNSEEIFL